MMKPLYTYKLSKKKKKLSLAAKIRKIIEQTEKSEGLDSREIVNLLKSRFKTKVPLVKVATVLFSLREAGYVKRTRI